MKARKIKDGVFWMGAVDWDRRLFDSLIPLPDGTSYNAYLVRGSEKTVLLDTVDPSMTHILMAQLEDVEKLDYVVVHHAEQDHSGALPSVLEKYPDAKVVTSRKGKGMVSDLLHVDPGRITDVQDGESISLGNKRLTFLYTPWVHWPETMSSYLEEDRILFSCDFFGSHVATSDLYTADEPRIYRAAKRYYAEIMMPFRSIIKKNLDRIKKLKLDFIASSHGPVCDRPAFIIDAYEEWTSDGLKNRVVLPYVSMHGSTRRMVEYLVAGLAERGISVQQFDLARADIGELAISLVDAATIIIGTPTVLVGPHPLAVNAAVLANALRPKLKFASVVGSYGWNSKAVEQIAGLIPNLKAEILNPVLCKGCPRESDYRALDKLADAVADRHGAL